MPHRSVLALLLFALLLLFTAPSAHAQDLNVYMAASHEVVGPGERTTYVVTVANTGSTDLLNVSVQIQLPDHINTFGTPPNFDCGSSLCNTGELITWSVGTVAGGQSRTAFYNLQIDADAPETVITSSATASASNASDAPTSLDVSIDPTPLLQLSVAPAPGPAVPGEPFTYTLTYGNVGSTSPTEAVLTMAVPEGTSFVEASGGGTEADGLVTWNIGLLGAAGGGEVRLTVDVNAALEDGDVLEAAAELAPGLTTEYTVRSSAVTPVRAGAPLHLAYALSQSTAGPADELTYTLTATNTGPVDLLDVQTRLLLPGGITTFALPPDFNCGSSLCNADEAVTWSLDVLAPGQSRTVFFRTFVANNTAPGAVLRSLLVAQASNAGQVLAAQDAQVDPTPLLRLSLAPDPGPAVPGTDFGYTLTFGNVGSTSPTEAVLTMAVPEGTSFVEASGGGTEADGLVTWNIGLHKAGQGGQVRLVVTPDAALPEGSLLVARAELDAHINTELVVRSSAVTPVRAALPLRVAYAVSPKDTVAGGALAYALSATNTGEEDLLDVAVRILLPGSITTFTVPPDFNCGSSLCNANEVVVWNVGVLAPGQPAEVSFSASIVNNPTSGDVLRSRLLAAASNAGTDQISLQQDVLVGTFLDLGEKPPLATITQPADGSSFGFDLDEGTLIHPAPDSAFVVEWEVSNTQAGDTLTYRWQLSASDDFGTLLFDDPAANDGAALLFETDFGALFSALSEAGLATDATITLYHRVVTVKDEVETPGPSAHMVLNPIPTGTEGDSAMPETFALYANYPNPFNPTTTFAFDLPTPAEVNLTVYDTLGRRVATVVSGTLSAGAYEYAWEASGLPSGVYLYRMEAGAYTMTRKLVLLK